MNELAISPPLPRAAVRSVATGLAMWLLAAASIGLLGILTIERPAIVPGTIVGSTIALVLLDRRHGAVRAVADAIDVRIPILFHALRAPIGFGFLVLATQGRLDPAFADIAGWGDLLVGIGALLVAVGGVHVGRTWRRVRLAWNALGLLDILVVIAVAQSILFMSDHPWTMGGLVAFPWSIVPLFVVPLVIATHLLLFRRLRG